MSGVTELRRWVVVFCEVLVIGMPAVRLARIRAKRVSLEDILDNAVIVVC